VEVKKGRGACRVGALRNHCRLLILIFFGLSSRYFELFSSGAGKCKRVERNLCEFPFTGRAAVLSSNAKTLRPVSAGKFFNASFFGCSPELSGVMLKALAMQRFTARLLLLLCLVGAFTPLLEALSGEPPHACCLRRLLARAGREPQISNPLRPNGRCCPPLVSPHAAQVVPGESVFFLPRAAGFSLPHSPELPCSSGVLGFSDRAPPF
jgi:hypothetical protein